MANSKPKDFWRYPQGEEDLIRFDIPDKEKALLQKLNYLKEELELCILNISSDKIFNEIILQYQPQDQSAVRSILFSSEFYWNQQRIILSDWMRKGFEVALLVATEQILSSLDTLNIQEQ